MTSTTGNKGFTLIEVLVAVVIFAIGIVAVGRAFVVSIGALGIGRENTEAFCLLKQKMSELELEAFEKEGLSVGTMSGYFEGDYSSYAWKADVKAAYSKLNEVDLEVRKDGSRRAFSLAAYVDAKE